MNTPNKMNIINTGIFVIGTSLFAYHSPPAIRALPPIELRMELQEKLTEDGFELPVVMISGHADVPMATD